SSHERFTELSNGNRIRETISYAPRGNIYDRNGRLLASNTIAFQLSSTPYLVSRDESIRSQIYDRIGKLTDTPPNEIKRQVEANGLDYPLPIAVGGQLEHGQALALMQWLGRYDGFHISEVPIR